MVASTKFLQYLFCFKTFYRSCIFNNLTLSISDYVMVSNEDNIDPESIENADVAQILYMYENMEKDYRRDRCRAIVKWYTRPKSLPTRIIDDKSFGFNFDQELIDDDRFDNDISIETIFAMCNVAIVRKNISVPEKTKTKKKLNFICRYKLHRKASRKYELMPIIPEPACLQFLNTPSKRKTIGEGVGQSHKLVLRRMSQDATPNKKSKQDIWEVDQSRTPLKQKMQQLSPIRDEDSEEYIPKGTKSRGNSARKSSYQTPSKRFLQSQADTPRRKSILKTPNAKNGDDTPKKRVSMSAKLEIQYEFDGDENVTPPKSKRRNVDNSDEEFYTPRGRKSLKATQSPGGKKTPRAKSLLRDFTIGQRPTPVKTDGKALQLARERLHVSAVPKTLPCRDKEFQNIYSFLEGKLLDNCGGCMYVSGVPGTGKTATTTEVIRTLQQAVVQDDIPEFDFLDINGMRLTEPRQAYVHIYRQLTGKTISWEHAYNLLDKRFNTPSSKRKMTILLVDELDILCNKRQDVVYNLLNWPTLPSAKLVVITIANTMDLPERLLMGKITSRLGLTRLTFQPYNFQQLTEILNARLTGTETFNKDAVQLVARKVAAVSGDARRALDICRRATEIAEAGQQAKGEIHIVSISDVQQALTEMIASAKIQAIKSCSKYEQMWLQALCSEVARTGVEECLFLGIYSQFESITAFNGIKTPNPGQALGICSRLGASRLLITEHCRQDLYMKVLLNISSDDVHYALQPN